MCRGDGFISQQHFPGFIKQLLEELQGRVVLVTHSSTPGKIRDKNTRDPLGDLMNEDEHITVLSFPRGKVTLGAAGSQ